MGSVQSMLEEASPVILEKSRVPPAEDLSCLCLITILWFTFLETWNQYVSHLIPSVGYTLHLTIQGDLELANIDQIDGKS